MDLRHRSLLATFCHAPRLGDLDLFDALIGVDGEGDIASVLPAADPAHAPAVAEADRAGRLVRAPPRTYVLPGLVDLHVHAPQYPQLGVALDLPLADWLQTRTFPLEAKFADAAFAERVYAALVADLIGHGTTTCVYFATLHRDATQVLVDTCLRLGQRALIGRVAMDHPEQCPSFYRDASPEAALSGTRDLIDYVTGHPNNSGLVHPVVTPRFIPSCTDATLTGLGEIARAWGCHVQTHCSESDWAHAHVLERFGVSDAEMLDQFGLLGRRSVLAHGNFLSGSDMDLLAARGAGIAHCPLSNAYFANAVFPLREALARGVRVGLGTDISGGYSASMFESCRMAVTASRMLESGVDPRCSPAERGWTDMRIDFATAFFLATAGGGDMLDLPIGRFVPRYHFDAMLIDPSASGGTGRTWEDVDDPADRLQKVVCTTSRANIATVWIGGRDCRPA